MLVDWLALGRQAAVNDVTQPMVVWISRLIVFFLKCLAKIEGADCEVAHLVRAGSHTELDLPTEAESSFRDVDGWVRAADVIGVEVVNHSPTEAVAGRPLLWLTLEHVVSTTDCPVKVDVLGDGAVVVEHVEARSQHQFDLDALLVSVDIGVVRVKFIHLHIVQLLHQWNI